MDEDTGEIDPSQCVPGTYTITYDNTNTLWPCTGDHEFTINIFDPAPVTLSYPSGPFCEGQSTGGPTISGGSGSGTFSVQPSGLSHTAAGSVNLNNAVPGQTYTVTYVDNGFCGTNATDEILVQQSIPANFSFPTGPFCIRGTDPTPIGPTGGVYTSGDPDSCVVDSFTGQIYLNQCVTGTYWIYCNTPGPCGDEDSVSVTLVDFPALPFTYPADSFCVNSGQHQVVPDSNGPGTFDEPTGRLTVDPDSGMITVGNVQVGNYKIYFTPMDPCIPPSCKEIWVVGYDNAYFEYEGKDYCIGGDDPALDSLPLSIGTFSISGAYPSAINPTSGRINLNSLNRTLDTFVVTFQTNGFCPASHTDSIITISQPIAEFGYPAGRDQFCVSEDTIEVEQGIDPGGTWTVDPVNGLDFDFASGSFVPLFSTIGNYRITYAVDASAGGCPDSHYVDIEIYGSGTLEIAYDSTLFCPSDPTQTPDITNTSSRSPVFYPLTSGLKFRDNSTPSSTNPSSSGEIDPLASVPGTYTIEAWIDDPQCPISDRDTVTIAEVLPPEFYYEVNESCNFQDSVLFPLPGYNPGGTFQSDPGLLIDPTTGAIDLGNSDPGTYLVTYTLANGRCEDAATQLFSILTGPTAVIDVLPDSTSVFCEGEPIIFSTYDKPGSTVWFLDADGNELRGGMSIGSGGGTYQTDSMPTGMQTIRVKIQDIQNCVSYGDTQVHVQAIPNGGFEEVNWTSYTERTIPGGQDFTSVYLYKQIEFDYFLLDLDLELDLDTLELVTIDDDDKLFWDKPREERKFGEGSGVGEAIFFDKLKVLFNESSLRPGKATVLFTPVANDCEGLPDTLVINVNKNGTDYTIPGIVTPNGDFANDNWEISLADGLTPDNYVVKVFNRENGLVQQLNSTDEQLRVETMPDGIYWYILLAKESQEILQKGGLVIKRD